jgi:hypothetical protein
MVVTIAESGQLSETAPIVDSSLVESNVMKDSLRSHCLGALTLTQHPPCRLSSSPRMAVNDTAKFFGAKGNKLLSWRFYWLYFGATDLGIENPFVQNVNK